MKPDNEVTKCCSVCRNTFPANSTYFHRDRTKRDGLKPACKYCIGVKSAAYYATHYQEIYKRVDTWKKQNPKRVRASQRKYRSTHADQISQRSKVYRESRPDLRRATKHRRRALMANAEGSHTPKDIRRLYIEQKGLCAYCSKRLRGQYDVEHVLPLSRGGSNYPSNLALVCDPCNTSKGNKTLREWIPPNPIRKYKRR